MARIRTIKPQFWTDESVVDLPFEYRLLFIGLWNFADDEGFLEDKPKQIKLWVFPADDVNVTQGLRALVKTGVIESIQLGGEKVLRIKGWKDHQVISRPTKSKYADAYADYQAGYPTHGAPHGTHGAPIGTPSGREGKGRERKGKEEGQVGGGGYVSSDAAQPPPPISGYEPWRCDKHQGIDVPCLNCKQAKADHKESEAQRIADAKNATRNAQRAEDDQRKADTAQALAEAQANPEAIQAAKARAIAAVRTTKENKP